MQDTFVTQQLITLAVTVGLGMVMGIGFDVLSVLRQFIRLSRTAQFVVDILFCFIMTVVVFSTLIVNNWGEVRAYVFLGLGIGGLVYYLLFHTICRKVMVRIVEIIVAVVRFIAKPFLWSVRLFTRVVRRMRGVFGRVAVVACGVRKKIKAKFHRKKKE
ncbi:MAG: spore cortex biosynthesis protein YabQ [Firmicutes bacterium]|nr:spore cortex biosynthesis protein YabQ [Bacillota bacterium]